MTLRVRILDGLDRETYALRIASPAEPSRLLDVLDEAEVAVPWLACRAGRCAICRVIVTNNTKSLLPAGPEEGDTLAFLGAAPHERLACQVQIAPGARGELCLRLLAVANAP